MPSNAIFVSPGGSDSATGSISAPLQTVKAAIARAGNGQTIVLRAGTYHENNFISASKNVIIQNYPGEAAWFDGSTPVTNWTKSGSDWVASGWNAQFDHSASFTAGSDAGGFVNPAHPMAAWPDQLFVDGTQFDQVAAGTNPGPGQFAVDYNAHTLTMGSDPTGHDVRASDLSQAFVVAGTLNLRGVGVRRYATSLPQIATVYFGGSVGGDAMENVVVTQNATQGISTSTPDCTINHVTSSYNGMTGIHGNKGNNAVIENSLVTQNNTQYFNAGPSSGGMKFTRAVGLVIQNNDVVDNNAINGIWTDVTVSDFTITGNTVTGNNGPYAVITELSDTGIVANNTISDAKYGYTAFDTGNVQVYNNNFSDNSVWDVGLSQDARRNSDPNTQAAVPWVVRNVTVSNNVFGTDGNFQFYALDKATGIAASSMNITVNGNEFTQSSRPVMVGWGGSNNTSVAYYRTPAALNSGVNQNWSNDQSSAIQARSVSAAPTFVAPLPADVASAVGQPTGTRHLGTF